MEKAYTSLDDFFTFRLRLFDVQMFTLARMGKIRSTEPFFNIVSDSRLSGKSHASRRTYLIC